MMMVKYSLGRINGHVVVTEEWPDLPLVIHTFDAPEDAITFYEEKRGYPFTAQQRRIALGSSNA